MKEGILPKAFRDIWSDEKLLNIAEQIVGPDIAGHPVWNLRPKVFHLFFVMICEIHLFLSSFIASSHQSLISFE